MFTWYITLWNGKHFTITGSTLAQAVINHNWNSSTYISTDQILSATRV